MRVIGLDLGSKRIGVALSDSSATIATPFTVINRSKKQSEDHRAIAALVREEEAEAIVVGLPLSMSGDKGPAARAAVAESEALATVVDVPVHLHDERLTTVAADALLMEAKMKAQARRRVVDKVAAAVMLQSWLDTRKHVLDDDDSSEPQ